jgi:hypothetical protein
MRDRDDPRTTELHNLRLALATFALQLDAFEARMSRLTKPLVAPRRLFLANVNKLAAKRSKKYLPKSPPRLSDSSG